MAVVIDSGEIPSAIGKTGKPLYSVVSKWQQKVNIGFNVSAEWLLAILREVDEHEVWKEWGSSSRDAFIADVLMLDYSVVEKAVPEIIQRVTSGKAVILEKRDGTKVRITPKKQELAGRRQNGMELREQNMKQQQIADKLGVSVPTIKRDMKWCRDQDSSVHTKNDPTPRKVTQYKISQYTKPEVAARKIREIFGDDFADRLDEELRR